MIIMSTANSRASRALLVAFLLSSAGCFVKADDTVKKLIKSKGIATIKLIECHVPDKDPLPGQGDSDVFVRVSVASTNQTICETPIIQDSNKPKFDLFDCVTKTPIQGDSLLKLDVYDSDKPSMEPDFIGQVKISMSDLIFNRRLDSAENYPIEGQKYPKHYMRARVSFKPVDL